MTNTIPNVPRELLADLLCDDHDRRIMAERHLLAMLANAPSPAGVDGLEVDRNAAFKACPESGCDWGSFFTGWKARGEVDQAIIDGLRGEVATLTAESELGLSHYVNMQKERDQQAQRIGELEAALEFACKSLAQVTSSDGSGHADIAVSVLRMAGRKEADASQIVEAYKAGAKWRIDAALSAGKEGE